VARRHGGDCEVEEAPAGGCRAVLTVAPGAPGSPARDPRAPFRRNSA
jgi:hypothetical protein